MVISSQPLTNEQSLPVSSFNWQGTRAKNDNILYMIHWGGVGGREMELVLVRFESAQFKTVHVTPCLHPTACWKWGKCGHHYGHRHHGYHHHGHKHYGHHHRGHYWGHHHGHKRYCKYIFKRNVRQTSIAAV